MERWTYNGNTNACESFTYGGCGGTPNNFLSEEACDNKCKRTVTPVTEAPETETATPGGESL